nr:radical SAM protein [Pelagibacterales bacterium]
MIISNEILLLHPPGWSLNYGSPHIALPLIKSYLEKNAIQCTIKDLNIEYSIHMDIAIKEKNIVKFQKKFNSHKAYELYFNKLDTLNTIAKKNDGIFSIKSGFNFNNCSLSSSADIKKFSKKTSPFTKFYQSNLIPFVKKMEPSIIGISATVPSQLLSSFEIFRILRKDGYDGLLVLGGNTVTRLYNSLYQQWIFKIIDAIILNQGEEALEKLWHSIQSKRDFENIPNLMWRGNDKIHYIGYKKLNQNNFSMPNFIGYPIGEYWGINYLPAISARGCYYGKCSFCSIPYSWGNNGFIGYDNPLSVINFMKDSSQHWGINKFSFVEETMSPKILTEVSKQIIKNKLRFKFEGYLRLEKTFLDIKILQLIAEAGLKKAFVGIELISSKNRSNFNKNDNGHLIIEYLKKFYDNNIKVHLFVMIGFPGTTKDDAYETVNFLLKYEKYIDAVDISHFLYS